MTEAEKLDVRKNEIQNTVIRIFNNIDKFYFKGNEKAGIRTRKALIQLSKLFKIMRMEMLSKSYERRQHKQSIKQNQI